MNAAFQNKLIPLAQAPALLSEGAVGVLPTDTVYGLIARARDPRAVAKLYALKHREHKPGTIIAASLEHIHDLGVPKIYLDQTENLWPNPLSIVLPVGEAFAYLHQGVGNIAIRVVDDPVLAKVLQETGPLLTSSANQPGEPVSTSVGQAWNYFKDSVDFYVDGGDRSGRVPSTIIRLLDDGEIEVIRPGTMKF